MLIQAPLLIGQPEVPNSEPCGVGVAIEHSGMHAGRDIQFRNEPRRAK